MSSLAYQRTGSVLVTFAVIAVVLVILAVVIYPLFVRHTSGPPQQALCAGNLHRIGFAMHMYSSAWDDRGPLLYTTNQSAPAGTAWPDLLMPYMKKIQPTDDGEALASRFRCPESTGDRLTYSFNRRASGLDARQIKYPSYTIAAFESVNDSPGNRNLNGDTASHPTAERLPASGTFVAWPSDKESYYQDWPAWARMRHSGANNVLWADGHVSNRGPDWSPQFDPAKATKEE